MHGALRLLALAVAVAIASRAWPRRMQDYVTRLVVQRFGTQIFNDGLRQTLRLRYQEFEDQRSGETLSLLLRVRRDTERFINAFINVAVRLAGRHGVPALVRGHQELAAGAGVPDRACWCWAA